MKCLISNIIIFFFFLNSFGQETVKYNFDYYSLYAIKNATSETILKRYIIGNSEDDSYFIYIDVTASDLTNAMSLYDTKKNLQIIFDIEKKSISSVNSFSGLTKSYYICNYNFEKKINNNQFFDIKYEIEGNHKLIAIKVFKNKKKKKLLSNVKYYLNENQFVKNQFYVTEIVFAYKFPMRQIKTDGVLYKQNTFDLTTNKIKDSRELLEIKQLKFSLDLKIASIKTRYSITTKEQK